MSKRSELPVLFSKSSGYGGHSESTDVQPPSCSYHGQSQWLWFHL